jgi:hypothetical protein
MPGKGSQGRPSTTIQDKPTTQGQVQSFSANPNAGISEIKTKKKVSLKILLLVITFIIALILTPFGIYSVSCKLKQDNVKKLYQASIDNFKKIKLLSSQQDVAPKVNLEGDCIDSPPYVQVDKSITLNANSKDILNDLRNTLTLQRVILSPGTFYYRPSCGYEYSSSVLADSITFSVIIQTYAPTSQYCGEYENSSESAFSATTSKFIDAQLSVDNTSLFPSP